MIQNHFIHPRIAFLCIEGTQERAFVQCVCVCVENIIRYVFVLKCVSLLGGLTM